MGSPSFYGLDRSITSAELRIALDGEAVARVEGPELIENLIGSLAWLARAVGPQARFLDTGSIILCGAIADLLVVSPGARVEITTDRFGSVACTMPD